MTQQNKTSTIGIYNTLIICLKYMSTKKKSTALVKSPFMATHPRHQMMSLLPSGKIKGNMSTLHYGIPWNMLGQ